MNPLPDLEKVSSSRLISNEEMHSMYGYKMRDCDAAYVMDGYAGTTIGNAEFAEMMIHKKTIIFEQ